MVEPPAILVAVVADVAELALPFNEAVIIPALKLPELSRATIAPAVLALVALLVTVKVDPPDPLYVFEPESPVPETPIDNVPRFEPRETPEIVLFVNEAFGIEVIDEPGIVADPPKETEVPFSVTEVFAKLEFGIVPNKSAVTFVVIC